MIIFIYFLQLNHATEKLSFLVEPHIESFNWFINHGIQAAVADLDPTEIETADGRRITCTNF